MGLSLGLGLSLLRQAGAAGGPSVNPSGFDIGSLINSDPNSPEWQYFNGYFGLGPPTVESYTDADGVLAWVNRHGGSPAANALYGRFVAPAGCTEVTLKVRAKSGSGTPAPYFAVWQVGGGPPTYLNPTLGGTLTEYTKTYAVTAGTEYACVVQSDNVMSFLLKSLRVEPTDGELVGTFYRLPLVHSLTEYNAFPDRWDSLHSDLALGSPGTRWDVVTDATTIWLEGGSNSAFADYAKIAYEVDNAPTGEVTVVGGYTLGKVTLAAGLKRVSPWVPPSTTDGSTLFGAWPRALYVGACTSLSRPVPEGSGPRILVYGDSIVAGYYAALGYGPWARMLRAGSCRPLLRATGGAALHFDGPDAATRQAWVDSLATVGLTFSQIYIEIGYNDYAGAYWANAAAFSAALHDLLVKLRAAYPSTPIVVQTLIPTTTLTNAHGETAADYRTAQTMAAAGVSNVSVIDGTTLCSLDDLQDGIHPTTAGAAVLATNITTALGL